MRRTKPHTRLLITNQSESGIRFELVSRLLPYYVACRQHVPLFHNLSLFIALYYWLHLPKASCGRVLVLSDVELLGRIRWGELDLLNVLLGRWAPWNWLCFQFAPLSAWSRAVGSVWRFDSQWCHPEWVLQSRCCAAHTTLMIHFHNQYSFNNLFPLAIGIINGDVRYGLFNRHPL